MKLKRPGAPGAVIEVGDFINIQTNTGNEKALVLFVTNYKFVAVCSTRTFFLDKNAAQWTHAYPVFDEVRNIDPDGMMREFIRLQQTENRSAILKQKADADLAGRFRLMLGYDKLGSGTQREVDVYVPTRWTIEDYQAVSQIISAALKAAGGDSPTEAHFVLQHDFPFEPTASKDSPKG